MSDSALRYGALIVAILTVLYVVLLRLLTTAYFQSHVTYLHVFQMTWFKDLDVPEVFGFLRNQVTPFNIQRGGSENLYVWHILPTELYHRYEKALQAEKSGFVSDFTSRLAFRLLHDDPDAHLVIHMHGAGGTVGSGYRPANYRALLAQQHVNVHVLTFDYRGFGRTPGFPSECGIISDALGVVDWALHVAKVPASQIVIFGQSLGTAVCVAVAEHYAKQEPPIVFAGHILVAPFVDVATLISTYSIAGRIPLLGPVAMCPPLLDYLRSFVRDTWLNQRRIVEYVRMNETKFNRYQIILLHAMDDRIVPWYHTPTLFWHAVSGATPKSITLKDLSKKKVLMRNDLEAAGSVVEWRTKHGVIREEILKYGLHDIIMGNAVVTLALLRILRGCESLSMVSGFADKKLHSFIPANDAETMGNEVQRNVRR